MEKENLYMENVEIFKEKFYAFSLCLSKSEL